MLISSFCFTYLYIIKFWELPEIIQLYLRKMENYNESFQGLSAAYSWYYKKRERNNYLILFTWSEQFSLYFGEGHRVELSYFYFYPLLFYSSIFSSSIPLPSCISLKGFLFPSIVVLVAVSFPLLLLLFPSGFSCSSALSSFSLMLQKARRSSQTSETNSESSVLRKHTCEWSL